MRTREVLRELLRSHETDTPPSTLQAWETTVRDWVESAWGAVPALLLVRFPRPLAEPGVRLSPHRALHGLCRGLVQAAWTQGLGIWLPRMASEWLRRPTEPDAEFIRRWAADSKAAIVEVSHVKVADPYAHAADSDLGD
ncbi:hypothetical protein GCM10023168_27910 [Fodinibacter luteus]|uniref:Uncharacterized protein n=1 Tax=Fodinibacter luteus TaxID=552064 RepID=A0ABP8KLY5_9MICO